MEQSGSEDTCVHKSQYNTCQGDCVQCYEILTITWEPLFCGHSILALLNVRSREFFSQFYIVFVTKIWQYFGLAPFYRMGASK